MHIEAISPRRKYRYSGASSEQIQPEAMELHAAVLRSLPPGCVLWCVCACRKNSHSRPTIGA